MIETKNEKCEKCEVDFIKSDNQFFKPIEEWDYRRGHPSPISRYYGENTIDGILIITFSYCCSRCGYGWTEKVHKTQDPILTKTTEFNEVVRLEVIDDDGRSYVNSKIKNIRTSLQDNNQTLKIFINK